MATSYIRAVPGTTVIAPAKLTVSLRVTGVRPDGFHLIDAEMVTVDLVDTLTFDDGDGIEVEGATGLPVPADDDNLVRRALHLLDREAHVRVTKRIPAGAGLGGGSADAAAVFRWAAVYDVDLALVIHTRDAWDDTFDVLAAEGTPERTIFHCFTGGPPEARGVPVAEVAAATWDNATSAYRLPT